MLYQLSYASPSHRKPPRAPFFISQPRTDTLPLRAYYGTKIKVSTPAPAEQLQQPQTPSRLACNLPVTSKPRKSLLLDDLP